MSVIRGCFGSEYRAYVAFVLRDGHVCELRKGTIAKCCSNEVALSCIVFVCNGRGSSE